MGYADFFFDFCISICVGMGMQCACIHIQVRTVMFSIHRLHSSPQTQYRHEYFIFFRAKNANFAFSTCLLSKRDILIPSI